MICNGRFPTIIAIASVLLLNVDLGPINGTLASALVVGLIVILGVFITLGVSYLLSKTILKGVPSSFTLELPPYRTPQLGRILYTSIIDRTLSDGSRQRNCPSYSTHVLLIEWRDG